MKLAEVLKPGTVAEIDLHGSGTIILGGPRETHKLERVDDAEQVVHLLTVVSSGRLKGQKGRVLVPYRSIKSVTTVMA